MTLGEYKMNPEIKERWLAALRSGDYKQTDGYLNVSSDNPEGSEFDGYCCLGVLCEIAVADGVIQKQRVSGQNFFEFGDPSRDDWDYSVLPISVQEWAGLTEGNPSVNLLEEGDDPEADNWTPVSEPNDNGASFEKIADLIERDL